MNFADIVPSAMARNPTRLATRSGPKEQTVQRLIEAEKPKVCDSNNADSCGTCQRLRPQHCKELPSTKSLPKVCKTDLLLYTWNSWDINYSVYIGVMAWPFSQWMSLGRIYLELLYISPSDPKEVLALLAHRTTSGRSPQSRIASRRPNTAWREQLRQVKSSNGNIHL